MIPFPPKRILVPFDFSKPSLAALETARRLQGRLGGSLELFFVERRPSASEAARRTALKKLARVAGPTADIEVAHGEAAPAIVRRARYGGADLVVMGTRGRVGLRRLTEGSVTEAVVREADVPVLSVHEPGGEPVSVLAPMNFEPYAEAGLVAAAQAADQLGASLTVMHVEPSRDDRAAARSAARLEKLLEGLPDAPRIKPRVRVEGGDPVEAILEAAPAYGLVVLVARRKSVISDAVLGTTAEQVLRRSAAPVLTVPCPVEVPEGLTPSASRPGSFGASARGD